MDKTYSRTACIQFDKPSYSVNETDGSLTLTVTRNGNVSGSATVHYATSDGTATAPADYTATSGDLSFVANETSKTIQVPIIEDTDPANELEISTRRTPERRTRE